MSRSELKRLHLVKQAVAGKLKQVDIAEVLRISERQVGRLVKRVKEFGDEGIIHGLRGRESNRRYSEEFKKDILDLYHKKYEGFGPLFAIEKFIGKENRKLSDETLRKWLKNEGEWDWERKSRVRRRMRERKEHSGEMEQMDGSHHDWLEGRGPWLVLMGYIDDATSDVYGRFYDYEGTKPAMDSFRRYIRKYGIPNSLYADKHTTYQSWEKLSEEDELEGKKKSDTQFGRAVKALKVTLIPANSPQAKGRVERLWKTLQDRLVKDMRLAGINTKEEANRFLDDGYWDKFNDRFGVVAKSGANLHRRLEKGVNLDRIFCIKKRHTLRNDFTVIHETNIYQVYDRVSAKSVEVEESLDGRVRIYLGDRRLKSKQLAKLPENKAIVVKKPKAVICTRVGKQWIPPKDHPWRSFNVSRVRGAA